jgi:hypothetical protein
VLADAATRKASELIPYAKLNQSSKIPILNAVRRILSSLPPNDAKGDADKDYAGPLTQLADVLIKK